MSNINKNKRVLFSCFCPKYSNKYVQVYLCIFNKLNMYKNKIFIIYQKKYILRKCFQKVK